MQPPLKRACLVVPGADHEEIVEGSHSSLKKIFQGALLSISHVFNAVRSMFSPWIPESPVLGAPSALDRGSTSAAKDGTLSVSFVRVFILF